MILPINRLIGIPIMSLQTGVEIARTSGVIVDPRQLIIAAFWVSNSQLGHEQAVLHPSDIRELSNIGLIVDDTNRLMPLDGLARLQEVIDFKFELMGIRVRDERRHQLGKVSDYSVDPESFTIQQLMTKQSFLRSLRSVGSIIHRNQIISVNNQEIVVESPTIKEEAVEKAAPNPNFVNPFRKTERSPEPD